jgi:HK97 family phage prohead protease
MNNRAYTLLTIKRADEETRTIVGIASTPTPDRMGDVVEPDGAEFSLPIPLLWHHDARQPVGQVTKAKVTPAGIEVTARFVKLDEPGKLKDRLDEAWQSVQSGLVKGLSIGFRSLEAEPIGTTYALRHKRWEWVELSCVTVPANAEATITAIKAADLRARGEVPPPKKPAKAKSGFLSKPISYGSFQDKIWPALADSLRKLIEKKCAPIRERVAEVEKELATVKAAATGAGDAHMAARVTELEKLFMELKHEGRLEYHGVWNPDQTYSRHATVTAGGCLWIAREGNQNCKPGASGAWQLAVKKGRDGRDLRDHRDRTTERPGATQ